MKPLPRNQGGEVHLHSLAEIRIAEWFRKSESVVLDMEGYGICEDCGNCMFTNPDECVTPIRIRHDLKKWYRECEIEKPCGDFVADILCPHESAPLLIEILVTHECSEEKKASGLRIVEIVIESEEDIESIVSSSGLRESEKVRLYGFRRPTVALGPFKRSIGKFEIRDFGDGDFMGGFSDWCADVNCRNHRLGRNPETICQIAFAEQCGIDVDHVREEDWERTKACLYAACEGGAFQKACEVCFWSAEIWGMSHFHGLICKLYKRCGNPKWCDENNPARCRMFRKNVEVEKKYLDMFKRLGTHELWIRGTDEMPGSRPRQIREVTARPRAFEIAKRGCGVCIWFGKVCHPKEGGERCPLFCEDGEAVAKIW